MLEGMRFADHDVDELRLETRGAFAHARHEPSLAPPLATANGKEVPGELAFAVEQLGRAKRRINDRRREIIVQDLGPMPVEEEVALQRAVARWRCEVEALAEAWEA